MKGKSKTQKGITLIALIVTIVVLLILAVVALNGIRDNEESILGKTNDAVSEYLDEQNTENTKLDSYDEFIETEEPLVPPTKITVTKLVGNTITVKTEGTINRCQYSIDGENWSDKIPNGENYTFNSIPSKIYARAIGGSNNVTESINIEIIQFRIHENFANTDVFYDFYAENGMTLYDWANSPFTNNHNFSCSNTDGYVYWR